MLEINYYKGKLTIAENWNELNGHQVRKIAALFLTNITHDVAYLEILRILASMSRLRFMMLPLQVKAMCTEHVQWVLKDVTLTNQLIPVYDGFYGPADEMKNLKLSEFHFCEVYYQQIVVDRDDSALDKLVAVLYREPKHDYDIEKDADGDVRVKFNSHVIDYDARTISRWPKAVKQAILLHYDGCRQHWAKLFPDVFSGGDSDGNYYDGLFGMMRNIAGPKYGTFENVEDMYVMNALLEVDYTLKEAEQAEQQLKAV